MYQFVFLDIDGVFADNEHRVPLITGPQKDWKTFMDPDLVGRDRPMKDNVARVEKMLSAINMPGDPNPTYFFLTGRSESVRLVTTTWIANNFPRYKNIQIVMRGNVKVEQYNPIKNVTEVVEQLDYTPSPEFKANKIQKVYSRLKAGNRALLIDNAEKNKEQLPKWCDYLCLGNPEMVG